MKGNDKEKKSIRNLREIAKKARQIMADSLIRAGCGHPGGAFSSVDIITALYFSIMNITPRNPGWEKRDRFILSKGHSSVALYSVLCLKGFIERKALLAFRQDNSILSGHPDMHKVSGIEASTGSLGHGLSIGIGMALAAKFDKKKYRVFVLMGDGETQEGSVWEAAMFARQYKLDNLVAIVDRNMLQIDGFTEKIIGLEPYKDKWKAFGWEVRIVEGHDMPEIVSALSKIPFKKNRPSLLIAKTIKGKGISFMENSCEWHGKALKDEHAQAARRELECVQ